MEAVGGKCPRLQNETSTGHWLFKCQMERGSFLFFLNPTRYCSKFSFFVLWKLFQVEWRPFSPENCSSIAQKVTQFQQGAPCHRAGSKCNKKKMGLQAETQHTGVERAKIWWNEAGLNFSFLFTRHSEKHLESTDLLKIFSLKITACWRTGNVVKY